LITYFRFLC